MSAFKEIFKRWHPPHTIGQTKSSLALSSHDPGNTLCRRTPTAS